MKLLRFTFKNEAKWMVILSILLPFVGLLVLLIVGLLNLGR